MNFKLLSATTAIVLTLGALAFAPASFAHEGATGVVKERMDMMKDTGKQMKTIGKMVKGKAAYNAKEVEEAARTIADHAKKIPEMFPEGTGKHPSEAKPEIWKDWKTFEMRANELNVEAEKLAEVAKTAPDAKAISEQFSKVGKTCGACHETFREKHKD